MLMKQVRSGLTLMLLRRHGGPLLWSPLILCWLMRSRLCDDW
jgi:hypothetical protein